jgi:AraC family transcriptional regulator, regulatory protein of adaptative response / DNA-3-methyladenine glycosylase II
VEGADRNGRSRTSICTGLDVCGPRFAARLAGAWTGRYYRRVALDSRICSRARLARDARFDGKFFIAVVSTGIYCRPICRARTAKESNVRYYPSAAAAAAAGFRPCLRCRPESSPGTPGWLGTPSTVSRALRLISESGLEDGGVETLAERLGIGARHLRRLFVRHLGAPPSAVAETRRLHFTKKLIDETRLPMNQVALAAGFGCVRRFNAAIRATYHRTPTQIRRLARKTNDARENRYSFRLGFRPPYEWDATLRFLSAHATPGVESVSETSYRRSISLNGCEGWFAVSREPGDDALAVEIDFGEPQFLFAIVERIRAMFDLDADPAEIARWLNDDPLLARLPASGTRVPGCWDGFELAVAMLLAPRAGWEAANELIGRVVEAFGRRVSMTDGVTRMFPGPDVLAAANLRRLGISAERADAIAAVAKSVAGRRLCFSAGTSSDSVLASLRALPCFDRSAAEWIAMRALREPDAFPPADAALLRGARLQSASLARRAEKWRPWRAYAAMCLWHRAASRSVGDQGSSSSDERRHAAVSSW